MPLTILDLPVEILHLIVETASHKRSRRYRCYLLRLTCKEINAKLLRYYGVNFYKRIEVPLTPDNLADLCRLSQNPLARHVESLTLECDAIVSMKPWNGASASKFSEADAQFFDTSMEDHSAVLDTCTIAVLFKSCPVLLGPALSRLTSLKEFRILKPHDYGMVTDYARKRLSGIWSMVVRNLFMLALSQTSRLEVLAADSRLPLYACASVLENMAMFCEQNEALTTLYLGLGFSSASSARSTITQHAYVLKQLLNTSPNLVNLDLSFDDSDSSTTFFNLLGNSTSSLQDSSRSKLYRLSLSYLKTSFMDLQTFLIPHTSTLQALSLISSTSIPNSLDLAPSLALNSLV